jgi:hypothetical protein
MLKNRLELLRKPLLHMKSGFIALTKAGTWAGWNVDANRYYAMDS